MIFLSILNLFIYYDRGIVAAVLKPVTDDFTLTDAEGGALGSAFLLGFMIFSPIFVGFTSCMRTAVVMFIGLIIWSLSTVGCAMTHDFWTLAITRLFVGIGEASFCGIAPTFIDDNAPPKSRTRWLSVFYSAIPIGAAAGYLVGGLLADVNWRLAFWTEGVAMLPFAMACLLLPQVGSRKHDDTKRTAVATSDGSAGVEFPTSSSKGQSFTSPRRQSLGSSVSRRSAGSRSNAATARAAIAKVEFFAALRAILTNPLFMLASLGYSCYTFTLGGVAFWGPTYAQDILNLDAFWANMGFSGTTVVTGFLGTALGGIVVDKLGGSVGINGTRKCLMVCWLFTLIAIPLGVVALLFDSPYIYFGMLMLAQVNMFMTTAPINGVLLSSVPPELRAYAMATNIFMIHALGDFPSPLLVGVISDATSLRVGMIFLILWNSLSIVLWILAWLLTARLMSRLLNRPPVGDPALDAGAYDEVEGGSEMSNVLSVGKESLTQCENLDGVRKVSKSY